MVSAMVYGSRASSSSGSWNGSKSPPISRGGEGFGRPNRYATDREDDHDESANHIPLSEWMLAHIIEASTGLPFEPVEKIAHVSIVGLRHVCSAGVGLMSGGGRESNSPGPDTEPHRC